VRGVKGGGEEEFGINNVVCDTFARCRKKNSQKTWEERGQPGGDINEKGRIPALREREGERKSDLKSKRSGGLGKTEVTGSH